MYKIATNLNIECSFGPFLAVKMVVTLIKLVVNPKTYQIVVWLYQTVHPNIAVWALDQTVDQAFTIIQFEK